MGIANRISIFRVLLVPAIVFSLLYYHPERDWLRLLAFALFAIGMLSDLLDGYLARRLHEESRLGALLDALADKILILATFISCSVVVNLPDWMRIPGWFNLVVISKEVILFVGTLIIFLVQGRWTVKPSRIGKCATFMQMLVIPIVLLHLPGKLIVVCVASVLTISATIGYLRFGLQMLNEST